MWNIKNYRLGFDLWGLGLFLLIMIPNFLWFAFPAPNDVLRGESITPLADSLAQLFQVIMAAALCTLVNVTQDSPMRRRYLAGVSTCAALYYGGWLAYYAGIAGPAVVLDLCLAPCGAFLFFAGARKNGIALLSAGAFTVSHLIFAIINFVI